MGRKQEKSIVGVGSSAWAAHTARCSVSAADRMEQGIKHVDVCLFDQSIASEFTQVTRFPESIAAPP
ncbi:hypothetical protein KUCAC02_013987, partial [Chaenocephalus aceratus]